MIRHTPMLLAALLAACSPNAQPTPGAAPAATTAGYRGAVLILLDTVRADHVSSYGHSRPTTPHIDQLASDGIRFERVVSAAPWTRPGVTAILSGEYPPITPTGEDGPLARSVVESIRQAGITTAAITEGAYVSRAFQMDRGFESWVEEEGSVTLPKAGQKPEPMPTGGIDHTFGLAQKWLAEHRDQKFFLLVHTYEAHAPYSNREFAQGMKTGVVGGRFSINLLPDLQSGKLALKESEIEYVKALYDGDLLNCDRHVGALLDTLRDLGLLDHTLVVVTSDHGEELADHFPTNIGDHGHSLHDELLLVPLVIRDPLHHYALKGVKQQVRTIDIMPTIAALLDASIDHPISGASLVPLMTGADGEDRPALSGWNRKGVLRFSLRDHGLELMKDLGEQPAKRPLLMPPPEEQLFDLGKDPLEQHDLLSSRPAVVQAMRDALTRRVELVRKQDTGHAADIDQALRDRLTSLGYGK